MSTVSPPRCTAAPFALAQARARLVAGASCVARAVLGLDGTDLAWAGRARAAYDDAIRAERLGLDGLAQTLDRCVVLLDAFAVAAEQHAAGGRR